MTRISAPFSSFNLWLSDFRFSMACNIKKQKQTFQGGVSTKLYISLKQEIVLKYVNYNPVKLESISVLATITLKDLPIQFTVLNKTDLRMTTTYLSSKRLILYEYIYSFVETFGDSSCSPNLMTSYLSLTSTKKYSK